MRLQHGRIVTDSKAVDEPKDPEANIIYQLYCLVASHEERDEMVRRQIELRGEYVIRDEIDSLQINFVYHL